MSDRAKRRARIDKLATDIAAIRGGDAAKLSTTQRTRLAALEDEHRDLRIEELRDGIRSGELISERGSGGEDGTGVVVVPPEPLQPFGGGDQARGGVRDQARRTLDTLARQKDGLEHVTTGAVEKVHRALDGRDGGDLDLLSRWTVAVADADYLKAFMRMAADPMNGHREFTDPELRAFQRVQTLSRAMNVGSGAGGGFLVPFQLDPSVILTSAGSANPVRQICRVVTATGDVWNGVSSDGVVAEWLAEADEAADASPTLAQPAIPNFKASAFIPVSFEAFSDMANGATEVATMLVDGKEQLEAEAFITGTGVGQPSGIATTLGAPQRVATTSPDVLVSADVYRLQESLGPRFQAVAQWAANLVTANQIAQFESTAGARLFPEISNTPPTLLRKLFHEASHLDNAGATAAAGNDHVAIYGDWQHYVVTDRIGTTIELVPHLFGLNRRPTGERGWLMWSRVGADSVADAAFRVLVA